MFVFVLFVAFVVWGIAWGVKGSQGSAIGAYNRLLQKGLQARGIMLSVSRVGIRQPGAVTLNTRAGLTTLRFERRNVLVDVEIPGQAPYEVQTATLIPSRLVADVIPGATLELRVDPKNPRNIAVVGLGVGLPAPAQDATVLR